MVVDVCHCLQVLDAEGAVAVHFLPVEDGEIVEVVVTRFHLVVEGGVADAIV